MYVNLLKNKRLKDRKALFFYKSTFNFDLIQIQYYI